MLAVQKGDQTAAAEHYAYLQGQRGTMITTVISIDRLLGLLSQTMGDLDQAIGLLEEQSPDQRDGCTRCCRGRRLENC